MSRRVFVYTLPKKYQVGGVKSVGLVKLTTPEEIRAVARSDGSRAKVSVELARACLAEVNDKPLSEADLSKEIAWARLHPVVRNSILQLYADLHTTTDAEDDTFLASHEASVESAGGRVLHKFLVPPTVQKDAQDGTREFVVSELTVDDELAAAARADGSNYRISGELAKATLYAINGEALTDAASKDTVWEKMDPKVRSLVATAYAENHTPKEDVLADFRASLNVRAVE